MTLKLALIGCGGMGRRHLVGFRRLRDIGRDDLRLVAVCDPDPGNAALARDRAAELLGETPATYAAFDALRVAHPDLDAILITTPPDLHAAVGVAALAAGIHVMVEKPIALTIRQGQALCAAAARSGRVFAVAENYRRDPINRLAKAILDAGVLGRTYLAVQSSSGSGERVIITPWRHQRRSGGIVVDMGIHYTDLLEYFLGPLAEVTGMTAQIDERRRDTSGVWHPVDAEDLSVGVGRFANGAIVNWLLNLAGRGQGHFARTFYGTRGTLAVPQDRSGRPLALTLRREGRDEALDEAATLALVPGFALDPTTAALFGGARLASYALPFAAVDANLLAVELADFADAILLGRAPEVGGEAGLRALAAIYAFLEAGRAGGAVAIDGVLSGAVTTYLDELDAPAPGA